MVYLAVKVLVCDVRHYELFQSWNEEGSIIFEAVTAAGRQEDEEKKWKLFKYHLVLGKHIVRAQACGAPVSKVLLFSCKHQTAQEVNVKSNQKR